ncbi:MAG: protein lplB [Herbinix sp.]|jgi:putative aldouronate transport system permease protein|nr:protein lplB [Herbinix sp.]
MRKSSALRNKDIRQAEKAVNRRLIKKNLDLYLFLIPGILFIIVFRYMPMYGLTTSFQEYNIFSGILESPWVGFKNFNMLFTSRNFYSVLRNTLFISFGKILFTFPLSIFIAILINEIGRTFLKKTYQTVLYLPHFLSWVIVSGLVTAACSPSTGIINQVIVGLGGQPISFLMDNQWFRTVVIASEAWKEVGYSAIVFIAALTGINPELYEAAKVDGAGKLRQIIHITLPGMLSIILLMFILNLGNVLNANTEEILLMYNPTVYKSGDVLGTFIYRTGVSQMNYSYATAIGLFESLVGLLLVLTGNFTSKRTTGRSIW